MKAVTYTVITDVQLSEYSNNSVAEQQTGVLKQGSQSTPAQQVTGESNRIRYRTRVASTATKVNLAFEETWPALTQSLLKSLAGLL